MIGAFRRFPPHSCGGLIEATHVAVDERHPLGVFPRIRAGASLKHQRAVAGVAAGAVFPRIRAGASLKQGADRRRGGSARVFPRIRAGASLKPLGG